MTTTTHQRHHSHTPAFLGEQHQYVFPASRPMSQATPTPSRRPSSSSALQPPASSFSIPSSARSDGSLTPLVSPTTFSFPSKQSTPRTAVVNLGFDDKNSSPQFPASPPLTPNPPPATLGERRGHTRRQSEIIGGKSLSMGGLSPNFAMGGVTSPSRSGSSSPVKGGLSPVLSPTSTNIMPTPLLEKGTAAPTPLGVPRRGHAHRRSAAMSSGDVMSLMLSQTINAKAKPGSTPSSPSDDGRITSFEDLKAKTSVSPKAVEALTPSLVSSPSSPDDSSAASSRKSSTEDMPRKSRVTFMEAPEIIPRPASAGTMSTMTTTKRGSIGGSVSSMASFAPSINSINLDDADPFSFDFRSGRRGSASDAVISQSAPRSSNRRPNSADASVLLNAASKASWLFPPLSPKDNKDATPKKASKKSKKAHSKAFSESGSTSMKAAKKSVKTHSPDGVSGSKKYKGGMKGWAGSILLRRHYRKQQMRGLPRRSPTPPLMQRDEIQRLMQGGSYVVLPPKEPMARHRSAPSLEDYEPIIDLGIYEDDQEQDLSSDYNHALIDLDAALGPFNTPLSPQNKATGFGVARHRMHSFNGIYHRRAESMPEMQLFSLAEDEIENDGMGDVFEDSEEDEDDEDEDTETEPEDDTIIADQGSYQPWNEPLGMEWSTNDGDDREELDQLDGITTVRKGLKRKMSLVTEEEIAKAGQSNEDENHFTFAPANSSSSASLPISPKDSSQLSPCSRPSFLTPSGTPSASFQSLTSTCTSVSQSYVTSSEPTPVATPTTTVDSGFPLATPPLSHTSEFLFPPRTSSAYDDDRSTVVSIASGYDADSIVLGEPGPEMRMSISVDDIPATSYASSTSALSFYPHLVSASVSAATMPGIILGDRRGSSSMASRSGKEKKDKRWSKVFSFWKK